MNTDQLYKIRQVIENRRNEVIDRNPHDHEFESGAEDFEANILGSIDYCIFSEDLMDIEKVTLGETIFTLRSILGLLESDGKDDSIRDDGHSKMVTNQFDDFDIKYELIEKEFHTEELSSDDNYEHLYIFTDSGIKIKVQLLSFFYMIGNDIEDYLYHWEFEDVSFHTNKINDLIKFILQN